MIVLLLLLNQKSVQLETTARRASGEERVVWIKSNFSFALFQKIFILTWVLLLVGGGMIVIRSEIAFSLYKSMCVFGFYLVTWPFGSLLELSFKKYEPRLVLSELFDMTSPPLLLGFKFLYLLTTTWNHNSAYLGILTRYGSPWPEAGIFGLEGILIN